MKIIFLDIDGVLNNALDKDEHVINVERNGQEEYFPHSKRCVKLLNKLTKDTGAKIVVTSTWRLGETDQSMQEVLNLIGVTGEYIGMTSSVSYDNDYTLRGNEILKWIQDHEPFLGKMYYDYREYVILDDDTDMLLWQKDNYVNCDPEIGITDRVVCKAKSILLRLPCEDIGQEFV